MATPTKARESRVLEPLTKASLTNRKTSALRWVDVDSTSSAVSLKAEVRALLLKDAPLTKYVEAVLRTIPNSDPFNNNLNIGHGEKGAQSKDAATAAKSGWSLSDFHYEFLEGKLVNATTGSPYHFVNAAHYDALSDAVVRHIQHVMRDEFGLIEINLPLPEHAGKDYVGPYCPVFASPDWADCDKLLFLVPGANAARIGQWSRPLCVHDGLDLGSVLPYLQRAKDLGFRVVVLNPNVNASYEGEPPAILRRQMLSQEKAAPTRAPEVKIKLNASRAEHVVYAWDALMSQSRAEVIAAVAHSAGGDALCQLIENRPEEVAERLVAVAFADSVHSMTGEDDDAFLVYFLTHRCRNWVASELPLDSIIHKPEFDCLRVSAGHTSHEHICGVILPSVFDFLEKQCESFFEERSVEALSSDESDEALPSTSTSTPTSNKRTLPRISPLKLPPKEEDGAKSEFDPGSLLLSPRAEEEPASIVDQVLVTATPNHSKKLVKSEIGEGSPLRRPRRDSSNDSPTLRRRRKSSAARDDLEDYALYLELKARFEPNQNSERNSPRKPEPQPLVTPSPMPSQNSDPLSSASLTSDKGPLKGRDKEEEDSGDGGRRGSTYTMPVLLGALVVGALIFLFRR